MRVSVLLVALLALAVFVAGCGGPKDPDKRLAEACKRQIEEVGEEEGTTPTAKSTEESLDKITLVECSGQETKVVAAGDEGMGAGEDGTATETGGDEGDGSPSTTDGSDETAPADLDPAARDLFAKTCGGCHTLSDAGTNGAVGPNLDETELDADAIAAQIANGAGAMPPKLLEGDDAKSVSEYVAAAAASASK